MKKLTIAVLTILVSASSYLAAAAQNLPVIKDSDKQRAKELVSKMTLEEKCLFIAGTPDKFHTAAIERVGIPSVRMADGPQGVRNKTKSTYYPCGLALAASWNREIAHGVGSGIGVDAKDRGVGIMLCPGVNIYRSALCGRNFEYMGEDPYLASETAVAYISGIQEEGTMATIKHFAVNNQEYQRHQVGSQVGERVINELYFPTFRKAVEKAKVGAVMTSYNPINGTHAAENAWLIRENLRKWGFEGLVMSDWGSTYSTVGCVQGGLNLEMGSAIVLKYELIKPLIDNGVIKESEIDEMVQYVLQTYSAFGFLDKPMQDRNEVPVNEESRAKAYAAAIESPVLLKNDGILPIKGGNIIVMGPNADYIAFGGGSGAMSPIEGTSTTLFMGLKGLGKKYKVTYLNGPTDEELIKKADAVIYAAGFNKNTEKEGADRTYDLGRDQNEAIAKAAELNSNLVVVVYSGGEIDVNPWIEKTRALIMGWYSGQEGGKALAAIISGAVSPSGRLPFTFWGTLKKNPASPYYDIARKPTPGSRRDPFPYTNYAEGLFLGYRGVEHFNVAPMFAFGYGLTYSSFAYSDIKTAKAGDGFDVSFKISNTGKVRAAEVAQLYISPVNAKVVRPAKELKGYEKVALEKGQTKEVTIHVSAADFGYYDTDIHAWKTDKGEYKLLVGASSEDIKLEAKVNL